MMIAGPSGALLRGTRQGYFLPAAVDRKFWAILGFSILLHGTLFALTAWQRKAVPASLPPILASIRLINTPESGPVVERAPQAAPTPVPQKARQEGPRTERPAPRAMPTAGPAIVPAPAAANTAASAESAAVAAPPAPAATPVEVARPAPPAASGETLDRYRQRLTELFARQHEYPRIAAMRGWEGEVRLRLKVARKGNLLGVMLDRSSGFDVLDRHALAMLEGFGNLPPLPESLDAGEIQVIVPINYKLRKTT